MKTPRRSLAWKALATTPLLALALTSCSADAASQDPSAIMSEYIENLNNEDFEAALELVHEPDDVTADSILKLESIGVDGITANTEEFPDGEDTQMVKFDIGGDDLEVDFTKVDEQWLLREPVLLTDKIGIKNGPLFESNASIVTDDGKEIGEEDRVIISTDFDTDLSVDVPEGDFIEASQFSATGAFSKNHEPIISASQDDSEFSITEDFRSRMEQAFGEYEDSSYDIVDFPSKEHCQVAESSSALSFLDDRGSFSVECFDEDQVNANYRTQDGGWNWSEEEASVNFHTTVSSGDIVESDISEFVLLERN